MESRKFTKAFAACCALLLGFTSVPTFAEKLCTLRTASGAVVYTNEPTASGECAGAARASLAGPAPVSMPVSTMVKYDGTVRLWSERYGVSPKLVHAVIATESAYNPGAVSPKGARGLMQLMPETARTYGGSDLFDSQENIRCGVAHLRDLLDAFGGDTRLAVAAYNAGAGAVRKYSGVPPYAETRAYVSRVLGRYQGRGRVTADTALVARSAPVSMNVDGSGAIRLAN